MRKLILFIIVVLLFINIGSSAHSYIIPYDVFTNSTTTSAHVVNDSDLNTYLTIGTFWNGPPNPVNPFVYINATFNITVQSNTNYYLQSYYRIDLDGQVPIYLSYYNYTTNTFDKKSLDNDYDYDYDTFKWKNNLINSYINNSLLKINYTSLLFGASPKAPPRIYESRIFVNVLPTIPTSFANLGNNLINHTPTITWTEGIDLDNDTVTTYVYVGEDATSMTFEGSTTDETYNLGTNNTLVDGQTYNYTLRSWDGYEFSNYTIADTFRMNAIPTTPTTIAEPNYHLNQSITVQWLNSTDSDADTISYDIKVGTTTGGTDILNEVVSTNESSSFNINQFETYYWSVRSNDTYELSDWSTEDIFSLTNTAPSISNVTLSPDPTAVENNLTALNDTATDTDGDPITLYYKWYKNSILQPALTTSTVGSSNTSNGELWKVGIIPNDGYENGTEVQSQTVEIGSANSAPTLTGISIDKSYPLKRYVNFTITSENASDPNNDPRKLEVGSATGLSDLGVGEYFSNGNESNIIIAMPFYDGNTHTLYIRLNDSNLTSQEYTIVIESDTTLPVLNSESVSPATGTQGTPFGITINTTSLNSTISTVTVNVARPDATAANWTLTNTVNDTWYYNYVATSDLGTYTVNYFTITDASDNIKTATSSLSATITAAVVAGTGPGGGSGSGSTTTIINATLGDLTLSPPRLDTYALYGGFGDERILSYTFIANRALTGCTVTPTNQQTNIATCEITDGYIVDIYLTINGTTSGYSGTITVTDSEEYVATSELIIRIIDIGAYFEIVNIPVGEALAGMLSLIFASEDGILVGLRVWPVGLVIGLLGMLLVNSGLLR